MNISQFTVRKKGFVRGVILFFALLAISVLFMVIDLEEGPWFWVFVVSFAIDIILSIRALVWRLTVDGNEMRLRTLVRRREFSIHDVRRVDVQKGPASGHVTRVTLYDDMGKLVTVKAGMLGFDLLLERLRQRNLLGVDADLAERMKQQNIASLGTEPLVLEDVKKPKKAGSVLWWQVATLILTVPPFVAAVLLGELPLSGAYTALEVLEAYLFASQAMLLGIMGAVVLVLIGNLFIITHMARTGRFRRGQVIFMLFIVILLGTVASLEMIVGDEGIISGESTLLNDMRSLREDIDAIEQGSLELVVVSTSLNSTAEPLWRLIGAETRVVYRMGLREAPYSLFYPRALRPSDIRENLRGSAYRHAEMADDIRVFEAWYTPNFRVVAEIVPRTS